MQNTLYMLLGAALVALGVLAAALADRIRGLRVSRETAPRERASRATSVPAQQERQAIPVVELPRATMPKQPKAPRTEPKVANDGGDDVIAALVAAGYKKPTATEATWACSAGERATVEGWTASALRRCARGGMS
jgi:hypothetical protein